MWFFVLYGNQLTHGNKLKKHGNCCKKDYLRLYDLIRTVCILNEVCDELDSAYYVTILYIVILLQGFKDLLQKF